MPCLDFECLRAAAWCGRGLSFVERSLLLFPLPLAWLWAWGLCVRWFFFRRGSPPCRVVRDAQKVVSGNMEKFCHKNQFVNRGSPIATLHHANCILREP